MYTLATMRRGALRTLTILVLALTFLSLASSDASAQYRVARGGYVRGYSARSYGGFAGGRVYSRGYGGFYGPRTYSRGYGGVYGARPVRPYAAAPGFISPRVGFGPGYGYRGGLPY